MKTFIALFRGINVGGKNSLPMKELVSLLEDLGCRSVKTYIQSGNAVFKSKEKDASRLSNKIRVEIKKRRGFEGLKKKSERFLLRDKVFYLYAPDGVGRSKLAASTEKLLGVSMTDRNWQTVCKIRDMVKESN